MPLLDARYHAMIHAEAPAEIAASFRSTAAAPSKPPATPLPRSPGILAANAPLIGVWLVVMLLCLGGTALAQGDVGMPPVMEPPGGDEAIVHQQVLTGYEGTSQPRLGDPTPPLPSNGVDPVYLIVVGVGQAVAAGFALLTAAIQGNAKGREAQINALKAQVAKLEERREEMAGKIADERERALKAELRLEAATKPPAAQSWPGLPPLG